MIALQLRVEDYFPRVRRAVADANFRALRRAAGSIRLIARRSIRDAPRGSPSPPGRPPRTRGPRRLKEAILYWVHPAGDEALIGPTRQRVGTAGAAHEFGGEFRGDDYPARPYMGPALETASRIGRVATHWRNSVRS